MINFFFYLDLGYAAYVSYLHMEVTHTNPVVLGKFFAIGILKYIYIYDHLLAFCYSLYDDVVKRRPKQSYDDECCIAPGELDDEPIATDAKPNGTKATLPKTKTSKEHTEDNASSKKLIEKKQKPITNDDDDDESLSVREVKPKGKSPSPHAVRSTF